MGRRALGVLFRRTAPPLQSPAPRERQQIRVRSIRISTLRCGSTNTCCRPALIPTRAPVSVRFQPQTSVIVPPHSLVQSLVSFGTAGVDPPPPHFNTYSWLPPLQDFFLTSIPAFRLVKSAAVI